ncbi:hypothetical protein FS749_009070 [Ceratobasidium sp. UAMH 11750]|nr:hypothetical protein FS749_009070 [Ceratobasidium sp. UAMH 11750]
MPGETEIRCICCHRILSVRQVYRHLAAYRTRLNALELEAAQDDLGPDDEDMGGGNGEAMEVDLDAGNPILNDAGPPFDDDLPALEEVAPALGNAVLALDGAAPPFDGADPALENAGPVPDDAGPVIGDAHLGLGDARLGLGNAGIGAPLAPVVGLRHNPPVVIETWYGPDYEDIIEEDTIFGGDDDPPINDPDRDPDYVERDMPPALDPIDEPRLGDVQMREVLQVELGDLADELWIDMYSRILSDRDHSTLSLLATRLRTHFARQTWEDLRRGVCKDFDIPSESVPGP